MENPTPTPFMGDTTISVPEELADELYSRKGRGETYADVIRRLIAAADDGDDTRSAAEPEPSTTAAAATREEEAPGTPTEPDGLDELVDVVAEEVLPGSGEKLDARREALRAVVTYLRDRGTASPADFREEVYPDHPAAYTSGSDPARSWWKNAMYPGLRAIAERADQLKKADTTGKWSYTEPDGGVAGT
jgi:hypothetical protein